MVEGHCEVPRGCPWPSATVKFYKFYFFLSFTLYLAPALPALLCPPPTPAPAPAIENVARRHRCPIIYEETTNDGGFFVFTTYLLLPFGKVTR